MVLLTASVSCLPVKFEDDQRIEDHSRSLQNHEESRVFHAHAMKKKKKKKLLHCLLSLQRNNNHRNGDPRTLFLNYVNLQYNQHGVGDGGYHDESSGGSGSNCLSQFTGGGSNYGDGESPGIGEGINNLSSFVGQVGEIPSNIVSSVGDGIKPVFENPERYLNRYFFRPLYRSLRPLYGIF